MTDFVLTKPSNLIEGKQPITFREELRKRKTPSIRWWETPCDQHRYWGERGS